VDLSEIVKEFAGAAKTDPNLLVGFETGDDAGVYRLTDELALVQTVDYITPVVDDPFLFGQVAAANSISDVYAMGGRPLTAMNLCNFPAKNIDKASLRKILEGGSARSRKRARRWSADTRSAMTSSSTGCPSPGSSTPGGS